MHEIAALTAPSPLELEAFHRDLDGIASLHRLNEPVLEERLIELERADVPRNRAYWLAYARLAELALFCAGGYADSGEVAAAGDLLVTPRRVEVYLRGRRTPVIKQRHTPLTVQFAHTAPDRVPVARWLAKNAVVQVREQALLPHMFAALQASEALPSAYLRSLDERMKRLADVSSARCLPGTPLHAPRCGFDLERFHALILESPLCFRAFGC